VRFIPAAPDANYFRKWTSLEGKWELGFTQMLFGVRVRCGQTGCGCVELDLCAGASVEHQDEILRLVSLILLPVGEDISPREFNDLFPRFSIKPIFNDPAYPELEAKAKSQLYSLK
jgi:hypothetical protein